MYVEFLDILIIIPDKYQTDIESEVKSLSSHDARIASTTFDFFSISMDEQYGTADSLSLVKDRIITNCMIVSCDVITNYPLINMINVFRRDDPSLVSLICTSNATSTTRCFGSSKSGRGEKDLVGLNDDVMNGKNVDITVNLEEQKKLVFFHSESDFGQSIPFSSDMIKKCSDFSIITSYYDAHVYIIKKSALDSLFSDRSISSLKGEFIPLLVKKQFEEQQDMLKKKSAFEETAASFDLGLTGLYFLPKNLCTINCVANVVRTTNYSSTTNNATNVSSSIFCIRSNNLSGFIEANKRIALESTGSGMDVKARNSIHSLVGDKNTSIAINAHIIRSVIGSNCVVGAAAKITDSIVMEGVTIEDGVVLQATVVCSDAKIGKKSSLERSLVSSGYKVHPESQFVDEFLADGSETEFVF